MRIRIFVFLILLVAVLASGFLVWAHGPIAPQDKTFHLPTQIGLPESGMSHGHETNPEQMTAENGLTRTQIADLVHKDQDKENSRSDIKLTLLTIFIIVAAVLFYPKRSTTTAVSTGNIQVQQSQVISSTPEPTNPIR